MPLEPTVSRCFSQTCETCPRQTKFLITSDFHGNKHHIATLKKAVEIAHPDVFVYAGDMSPIRSVYSTPDLQIRFLREEFMAEIVSLPVRYKYVMPGNTDFLSTSKAFLTEYQDPAKAKFVMAQAEQIAGITLLFYPYVLYTTHCLKDMEALNEIPDDNQQLFGVKQQQNHIFTKDVPSGESQPYKATDTLDYNLRFFEVYQDFERISPERKAQLTTTHYQRLQALKPQSHGRTLLFSHAPAYGIAGDLMSRKTQYHCGSKDIRRFIEETLPEAFFSGHIHQSVICADRFADKIGSTACYTIGNTGIDGPAYFLTCNYLVYDSETKECQRFSLDVPPAEHFMKRVFE